MRFFTILLGIVAVLSVASASAHACTCAGSRPPCESFGGADAVFVGTVTGVSQKKRSENENVIDWATQTYAFSVEQSYSGISETQVEVFTGRGGGDCGYPFRPGQRYLVYADRHEDKLSTSICTRTQLFENASEDLAFLGTLSSRGRGVTVSGEVRHSGVRGMFVGSDASVAIESDRQRSDVRPDANGKFRVSGVRPGKIKVTLTLPEKFTAADLEKTLTVSDRGCAQVEWYVTDNGRISGRVVDTAGVAVAKVSVSLENPSGPDSSSVPMQRTDDDGRFTFSGVPQGRYLLAVNRTRDPDPTDSTNAYTPTFYPGVTDETQARVITLEAGEKVSDLEVRVSKRAATVVEGSVAWPDGSPVKNALLRVKDITSETDKLHHMRADENGRFKIYGYVGQQLIIDARNPREDVVSSGGSESIAAAGQATITLERPTEVLRVVITKLR